MEATLDLTKLKVADLKKELKIRGLSQAGKRNELLDRVQAAIVAGVGPAEDDGEEEYDEDEILAGDDADDDDSKMTPLEEAAALAAKATATPRGRRTSAVATPRTGQKKLALRRTTSPSLTVPEEPSTIAAVTPIKAATPKQITPKKTTPAVKKAAAGATGLEPASKAIKLSDNDDDDDDTSNKENGDAHEKTALEKRSDRFGISSDSEKKEKRNARFGNSKLSKEIVPVDEDTLKARAARFGAVTSKALLSSEINEKKKARSERFKNGDAESASKVDVLSDDVKSKRTDRFAETPVVVTDSKSPSTPAKLVSASGKKLVTITV